MGKLASPDFSLPADEEAQCVKEVIVFGFSEEETWQSPMEIIRHCFYGQEISCVCVCVRLCVHKPIRAPPVKNLCAGASAAERTLRFQAAKSPSALSTWAQARAQKLRFVLQRVNPGHPISLTSRR